MWSSSARSTLFSLARSVSYQVLLYRRILIVRLLQIRIVKLRVYLGHLNTAMSQQVLQLSRGDAGLDRISPKGMPPGMGVKDLVADACSAR
jgi:hypothetical protein